MYIGTPLTTLDRTGLRPRLSQGSPAHLSSYTSPYAAVVFLTGSMIEHAACGHKLGMCAAPQLLVLLHLLFRLQYLYTGMPASRISRPIALLAGYAAMVLATMPAQVSTKAAVV